MNAAMNHGPLPMTDVQREIDARLNPLNSGGSSDKLVESFFSITPVPPVSYAPLDPSSVVVTWESQGSEGVKDEEPKSPIRSSSLGKGFDFYETTVVSEDSGSPKARGVLSWLGFS